MSRKAIDARTLAAEVLAEDGEGAPVSLPKGAVLASRQKSMSQMGHAIEYEANHWVDPALCHPSSENARDYGALTFADCEELIESIKAEGRQRIPAIVRETGQPERPYEIVAGLRRHFAISWLRANHYPDQRYLINIHSLDDEAAWRLSDLENRARVDISDLERGRSYANALNKHYGGSIGHMANRLNINESTLRRYLYVAELAPDIVAAFGGHRVLTVTIARDVKPLLARAADFVERLHAEAEILADEQSTRQKAGLALVSANEVLKRLKTAGEDKRGPGRAVKPVEISSPTGGAILSFIRPNRRAGLSIKFPAKPDATRQEIKNALLLLVDEIFGGLKD